MNSRFAALFSFDKQFLQFKFGVGYNEDVPPLSREHWLFDRYISKTEVILIKNIGNLFFFLPPHERQLGILNQLIFLPVAYKEKQMYLLLSPKEETNLKEYFTSILGED
jgi:hypothetical protein